MKFDALAAIAAALASAAHSGASAPSTAHGKAAAVSMAAAHRQSRPGMPGALHEPSSDFYVNAVQVYPWSDGAIYKLYTAPGQVSEIALQPGEALVSVAAGDTARWVIGDTASGVGAGRRTHVLVKPSVAGLMTNLLIATDRRLYRVQLASRRDSSMAGIAWSYPEDALLALNRTGREAAAEPVSADVVVDTLNFSYAIEGDRPSWRPVRAFDDGRQVFIQFPPSLVQGDAPPLFVVNEDGRAELVNYRLRGFFYVVDRLFDRAELRLGGRHQKIVRVIRTGGPRRRGARP